MVDDRCAPDSAASCRRERPSWPFHPDQLNRSGLSTFRHSQRPPVRRGKKSHPGGVPESASAAQNLASRRDAGATAHTGGVVAPGAPQPPATFWHPAGMTKRGMRHRPELQLNRSDSVRMGIAPAPGAVVRALADHCVRAATPAVWCVPGCSCSARGRAEQQPGRLWSPEIPPATRLPPKRGGGWLATTKFRLNR